MSQQKETKENVGKLSIFRSIVFKIACMVFAAALIGVIGCLFDIVNISLHFFLKDV